MSTETKVRRRAEFLGATLNINSTFPLDVEVIAPSGHIWKGTDVHAIVSRQKQCESKASVWAELLSMMEGIEPCTIPDCDSCEESEDER